MRETGPSSVMKVEHDYPVPKLAPGGVLVKNKYSGINFIDTYHRSGLYKRELPFIGGQEGGGFVAAVTPEAEAQGVKVGDRVAYSSVFQTYAEYTAVPANKVVTVPEEVPLDVAVSCGVQGMTAHYLTHSAHAGLVKPGEWMLIHGTGSGTCQWAAQMAAPRLQGDWHVLRVQSRTSRAPPAWTSSSCTRRRLGRRTRITPPSTSCPR